MATVVSFNGQRKSGKVMSTIDEEFVTQLIKVHRDAAEELEKIRDVYRQRKKELQEKPAPAVPVLAPSVPVPAPSDAKDKTAGFTRTVRAGKKLEREGKSQKTGTGISEKQFTTRESGSGNSTETSSNRRMPSAGTRNVDPLSLDKVPEAIKDSESSRPPSQRRKLKVLTTEVPSNNVPQSRAPSARRRRP